MRIALTMTALVLLATACVQVSPETVDVSGEREFYPERLHRQRRPVILIPGTLGSRLYNTETGEIAWGNFNALISELDDDLVLPIDRPTLALNRDHLEPYRVLDRAEVLRKEGYGEVSLYAELIDFMESALGYRPSYGRRVYAGNDLFVFYYDWRRSNVEAAVQLGEFIRGIRRDLRDDDMKFTFLCVSNGGIIADYYLRYGGRDVISNQPVEAPLTADYSGVDDCNEMICLGTPFRGSIDALNLLHTGYAPTVIARKYPPSGVFSFPAAFELLPDPDDDVFVLEGKTSAGIDLWDPDEWERVGLSAFSNSEITRLKSEIARDIRPGEDRQGIFTERMEERRRWLRLVLTHARRLKRATEGTPPVPTRVIMGVGTPTLARVGVERNGDDYEFLFRPRFFVDGNDPLTEAMYASGDGVVTRRSALGLPLDPRTKNLSFRGALTSVHVTPFTHRDMFEDRMLRLTLAELLTAPVVAGR